MLAQTMSHCTYSGRKKKKEEGSRRQKKAEESGRTMENILLRIESKSVENQSSVTD